MKILLFLLTAVLCSSCAGTQQLTQFIEAPLQQVAQLPAETDTNITFNFASLPSQTPLVQTEQLRNQFIPALLYYQWNNTFLCSINPQVVVRPFQNAFLKQAAISGLLPKLKGHTLEITVTEISNQFAYVNRGYAIILIVAYTLGGLEAITPEAQKLVVQYKLLQGPETVKKGRLSFAAEQTPLVNRVRSSRNFTRQYISTFLKANASLAEQLAERLADEL